MLQKIKGWI